MNGYTILAIVCGWHALVNTMALIAEFERAKPQPIAKLPAARVRR